MLYPIADTGIYNIYKPPIFAKLLYTFDLATASTNVPQSAIYKLYIFFQSTHFQFEYFQFEHFRFVHNNYLV